MMRAQPDLPPEEINQLMAARSPAMSWIAGSDQRYFFFSAGWLTFTGKTLAEALDNGWLDSVHPDDLQRRLGAFTTAFEARAPFRVEYRLRRADGQYRWVSDQAAPYELEDGSFAGFIGACLDIDDLLEAERLKTGIADAARQEREQFLNEELATTNEELSAANEELSAANEELRRSQESLTDLNAELEAKVQQRTRALEESEADAHALNEELTAVNEELQAINHNLAIAQRDLQKAYEQSRLSKEAAQLGTFDMDIVSGALDWDDRCRELFGISAQRGVSYETDFLDGLHPEDKDRVLAAIAQAMDKQAGNGDYDIEYRTIGSEDQRLRWVRAKGKAYFDETGKPLRFIGSVLDITQEKSREEQLREHRERQARLAAIVDTSDDTIVSKTLDGIITSWNRAAEVMFGYTPEEAIGRHISLIIPPERLNEEDFIIGQIRQGNKVDHFETIRVAKDGREIPISLTVSPLKEGSGNIIGASKIARDISGQVAAQRTAQRYLERLEIMNLVVESISEELDLNKILQKVTDATTQLTGAKFGAFFYNLTDERGESYMLYTLSGAPREAFEKFGMPRNTAVFHPTFAGQGVVRSGDITKDPRYGKSAPHYGQPKGHLPVVSYLAVPVISRSGEVIGGLFFGHPEPNKFTRDHEEIIVSIAAQAAIGIDNAKLYEEVKALNDKKDEFIGLASHELKTPLTSINGYLQIIARQNKDENSARFLNKALKQLQKLTTLVNDLLDVSKIEAGKLQLNIAAFDLVQVIGDTMELIAQSGPKHQLTFSSAVTECWLASDARRIEQVLINLLSNATKYSPEGEVQVLLECDPDKVRVGIRDFGVGIPADKLPHIFSRFYRVEDTNPNISGLGIGLYLSQEIITRLHGRLWAESEPGKGSVFYFTLPIETVL